MSYRLVGELDLHTAPTTRERLLAVSDRFCDLHIDCRELEFLDSSGLSALVGVSRRTRSTLVLHGLSPPCRRVVKIAGLDQLFRLAD